MWLKLAGGSGFWVGCLNSPPHTLSSSKKLDWTSWWGDLELREGKVEVSVSFMAEASELAQCHFPALYWPKKVTRPA